MNRQRNQYTDWNKVPLILNTTQAGLLLQMTPDRLSRLCRSGAIPAMQLGNKWRISREAIREKLNGEPTDDQRLEGLPDG